VGYAAKSLGFLFFASGDEAKEVTVGLSAESFRAVAVSMEKAGRKGARRMLAVFSFQSVECGQGNAVSAIEVAEGFKDFGFELVARVVARGFGLLGLRLRGRIGAYSFMNSHHLPPLKAVLVRARSVF
jgi:hypothetical protein